MAMRDQAARALTAMALVCLAAAFGLVGLGLLIAAVYLGLAAVLPAPAAAALTGLAALVVAGLILLICRGVTAPRQRRGRVAGHDGESETAKAFETASELSAQIGPMIRRHFPVAAGVAFLGGVILGASPRARKSLWRFIERQL